MYQCSSERRGAYSALCIILLRSAWLPQPPVGLDQQNLQSMYQEQTKVNIQPAGVSPKLTRSHGTAEEWRMCMLLRIILICIWLTSTAAGPPALALFSLAGFSFVG